MPSPIKVSKRKTDFKVKVAVRVKPLPNSPLSVAVSGDEIVASGKPPARTFAFDRCFDPQTSQSDIYNLFGHDIVQHALEGYNACIFAYGQTGSGKSHTMIGSETEPGLVPHVCKRLFEYVDEVQSSSAVSIRISFLEIYNEQVRDLLGSGDRQNPGGLRVRGTGGDDCWVEGLSEYKVTSPAQVIEFLHRGAKNRATAATKMNDTSSRSHAVVSLTIKQQSVLPKAEQATEEKISVLRLVDLAGSERAGLTGAKGERLREGSNINKSLVTLGRVISTLADMDSRRRESASSQVVVPYRESILTRLLENSLGGNSRTAMIACISPDIDNFDQTLSTLRYADQAKKITTRARINRDTISNETHEARLATMQRELNDLRQQLVSQTSQPDAQDESKLSHLIQFYEDEAARERVRTKMMEAQKLEAERYALELADYLRELSGKGLSSIDVESNLSFEALLEEQTELAHDISAGKQQLSESVRKWKQIVV